MIYVDGVVLRAYDDSHERVSSLRWVPRRGPVKSIKFDKETIRYGGRRSRMYATSAGMA